VTVPHDVTERVRARETERLLRKLDLSGERAEDVERLSRSLVVGLANGPIARIATFVEGTSRSTTDGEA
jgi:glutamyl-tRNA reductase